MKLMVSLSSKQRFNAAVCVTALVLACVTFGQGVHAEIVQDISQYLPLHPLEGDPPYKFTRNRNLELCRKIDAHLRANPQMNRLRTCEFPITPEEDGFTKPDWEALDPLAHMDVVREIFAQLYLWQRYETRDWPTKEERDQVWEEHHAEPTGLVTVSRLIGAKELRYSFKEFLDKGLARLERARFDLDFDGKRDTVYRFNRTMCDPSHPSSAGKYSWSYHVLERDNIELHRNVTGHSIRRGYDIFRYGGRSYVVETSGADMFIKEPVKYAWLPEPEAALICEFLVPLEHVIYPSKSED